MAKHRRHGRRYPARPPVGLVVLTALDLLTGLGSCLFSFGAGPTWMVPAVVLFATAACLMIRRPWGWGLAAAAQLLGGVAALFLAFNVFARISGDPPNQASIALFLLFIAPAALTGGLLLAGFGYLLLPHVRAAFGLEPDTSVRSGLVLIAGVLGLVLVILVVVVLYNPAKPRTRRTSAQAAIARPIERLGGGVAFLDNATARRTELFVSFSDARDKFTDATLSQLVALKEMEGARSLNLNNAAITDAGLKSLTNLTSLGILYLQRTRITDAGLKELKPLAGLVTLDLQGTPVTDTGLAELKDLPALHSLFLAHTKVTDAGLDVLKQFPSLRVVGLEGTQVTPEGAAALRRAREGLRVTANAQ